jgi:hypothetical protein
MSLRIRRGTDAQRTSIVFDQGELVWTSDTGLLFVGNGTTLGGMSVAAQIAGTGLTFNPITGKIDSGTTIGPVVQDSLTIISNDSTGAIPSISGINFNSTTKGGVIALSRGRGTSVVPVLLQNDDVIYELIFSGQGDDSLSVSQAAKIAVLTDGTVTNGITPGKLVLSTADSAGVMNPRIIVSADGLVVVYNGISTGIAQSVADLDAISLTTTTSYFITTGASTATLANGVEGQIKTLIAADITLGDMVVTVDTAGWNLIGAGSITFSQVGASCMLQYVNSAWYAISNNNVVLN